MALCALARSVLDRRASGNVAPQAGITAKMGSFHLHAARKCLTVRLLKGVYQRMILLHLKPMSGLVNGNLRRVCLHPRVGTADPLNDLCKFLYNHILIHQGRNIVDAGRKTALARHGRTGGSTLDHADI